MEEADDVLSGDRVKPLHARLDTLLTGASKRTDDELDGPSGGIVGVDREGDHARVNVGVGDGWKKEGDETWSDQGPWEAVR